MKRNSNGIPVGMIQRWTRPPISCKSCRSGKRRCNRIQPCSNCALRGILCEYEGKAPDDVSVQTLKPSREDTVGSTSQHVLSQSDVIRSPDTLNVEEILQRIRNLEDTVFLERSQQLAAIPPVTSPSSVESGREAEKSSRRKQALSPASAVDIESAITTKWSPVELHAPALLGHQELRSDIKSISKHLPPKLHAIELLEHFLLCVQPSFSVLHVPSTRILVERTYDSISDRSEELDAVNLLLLFSIFTSALLTSTPELLGKIEATAATAKVSLATYNGLALSLSESVSPCTTALEAIGVLFHVLTNVEGFGELVQQLRNRAFIMARIMQVHRLDTAQSRSTRAVEGGFDLLQLERQRRIWWHMVSNDWLLAFSGGPQEGTYIFHPRHMNVNYPCNIDDELIPTTVDKQQQQLPEMPSSIPTCMSYFLHRLYMADLCREVVDTIPSIQLEPQQLDYDIVLMLDTKFQSFIKSLPTFFQLDPDSVAKSGQMCEERPCLAWQRATLHFSIHTYICRLHRPFHLEGTTNAKYAYSRMTCVRSADAVLALWRSMAELGDGVGLSPARFWIVAQHVFLAAITLAAEVSFDPGAPFANVRKAEVLAACRMLESLQHESPMARDRIQHGVRTLLSTLQSSGKELQTSSPSSILEETVTTHNTNKRIAAYTESSDTIHFGTQIPRQADKRVVNNQASSGTTVTFTGDSSGLAGGAFAGETAEDWGQLWSEFFINIPGWDVPQWNSLLEDIDWSLGPAL